MRQGRKPRNRKADPPRAFPCSPPLFLMNSPAFRFDSFFESLKDNARNDQELANINHNLGNSLLKENKIDLAIEAYKTSLRINPNDEDTRYNLAYAQKMKQQQQ